MNRFVMTRRSKYFGRRDQYQWVMYINFWVLNAVLF
jgi:hypothetical protein